MDASVSSMATHTKRDSEPVRRSLSHSLTFARVMDLDRRIVLADAKQLATCASEARHFAQVG
jgi:hypothetical protein